MKIKDEDKIGIKKFSIKQYIPLESSSNSNKIEYISKLIFSFILFFLIFLFVIYLIKNKNNQLEVILSRKSIDTTKDNKEFLEKLKSFLDADEILENEMMNKHTTFQLGGPSKFFIKPKSINKIIKILQLCKEYSIEYFILGNGSNLLVSDQGYDGLIKIIVGGGMLMRTLAKKMCLLSLSGLEDIIDIPGTIGGGIIMNASAGGRGLIFNSLQKVKVITPDSEIKELSKEECKLRHRGSMLQDKKYLVIEATFNLIKDDKLKIQKTMADHTSYRYSRQPMYFPSAGSFFIWNKPKYGSLYQKYKENNLVSYRVGDAMIYTHNIAFIVNLGSAKSSDVYNIVTHIEKIIKTKYNLDIKREVVVLGSFA